MQSINELRWLVERKLRADEDNGFYCRHCLHYVRCVIDGEFEQIKQICPTSTSKVDYKDVAEFEAKVASIIPRLFDLGYIVCDEHNCPYIKNKCDWDYCATAKIRQARLIAEMCDD